MTARKSSTAATATVSNRIVLLNGLTVAAKSEANGFRDSVAALKAAIVLGVTDADFDVYSRHYRIGRMAATLGIDDVKVTAWLDDADAPKRSAPGKPASEIQKAYSAAGSAFSRVREAAGVAKDATKQAAGKASAAKASKPAVDAPVVVAEIAVPHFENMAEAILAVQGFATYLQKVGNANVKVLSGDNGMAIRDMINAFVASSKLLTKTTFATKARKAA